MSNKWFKNYSEQVRNDNLKAAKRILLDNINEDMMIYRYRRGINRDIENLIEKKIWLSNVSWLNDPYDSTIMIKRNFEQELSSNIMDEREIANYLKRKEDHRYAEELRGSLFVACFSEDNCSFPMWGYYADEHRGICIGYNLRELIINYDCMPVIYSSEIPEYRENDSSNNMQFLALTKSKEWKHEREWRIIRRDIEHKGQKGIEINNFVDPVELFVGCRRKNIMIQDNSSTQENWYKSYSRLDDIIGYSSEHNVDLYFPMIRGNKHKLIDKGVKIINPV